MASLVSILISKKINPPDPAIFIDKLDAIERINDELKEFDIDFDFSKLTVEEFDELFDSYCKSVFLYHPENGHQERGAVLISCNIFKKYGLTEEDLDKIDFY